MNYFGFDSFALLSPEIGKLKSFLDLDYVKVAKGSNHNHQAWVGGYLDHVLETMNIALWLYTTSPRRLPFKLSDAILVMFLHDFEKPYKGSTASLNTKEERRNFRDVLIFAMGIELTEEQKNAILYVEGEHDYSNTERRMNELAAFCHMCDIASARLWPNLGKEHTW